MVIGYRIAYEISLLPMSMLLLLIAAPLLLFIGFYIATTLDKKRRLELELELEAKFQSDGEIDLEFDDEDESIRRNSIIVTPHDLFWHKYTTEKDIIRDISNAVLLARRETRNYDSKISHTMFQQHLKNPASPSIAKSVQTFHIYNDEELRAHLEAHEHIRM